MRGATGALNPSEWPPEPPEQEHRFWSEVGLWVITYVLWIAFVAAGAFPQVNT
jgi:hypothetical protein